MAEGMTISGLDELLANANALPNRVREVSRGIARRTALQIQGRAQANLLARTKGTGDTARAITVTEDVAGQQFVVESKAPPRKPANLPAWLEFGTVKMSPKRYMRDAEQAERAAYLRDMEQAIVAVVREAIE